MSKNKTLIEYFSKIKDPRMTNKSKHKLIDIIILSVCALISNCDTFVHIELYGIQKIDWLKKFLDLSGGIPSHDTISRVFSLLDPSELQEAFQLWAEDVVSDLNLENNTVSIDGKYLQSTKGSIRLESNGKKTFFGMINAYSSEAGIAIGQLRTDFEKKNEVEATRELIKRLNLKGCTVTVDALSSQPETTEAIREKEADYLIALKNNQRKLFAKVEDLLNIPPTVENSYTTIDEGHGRIEVRVCTAKKLSDEFINELNEYYKKLKRPTWKDLNSVIKIESSRTMKGKTTIEVRYYLSNKDSNAEELSKIARSHWAIENNLHYVLDVYFNEDSSRVRNSFAGENLAVLRQMSLNLLKEEKTFKGSIKSKRFNCGWNEDYLEKVIFGFINNGSVK